MAKIVFTLKEKQDLASLGVSGVVLFGSHAEDTAGPMSDFDFGILLADPQDYHSPVRRSVIYDALYDLLSSKIKQLVDIDIVFLPTAPMELQSHVAKHGIPLYERDAHVFPRFREYVMQMYADFAPIRRMFHEAILARIPS